MRILFDQGTLVPIARFLQDRGKAGIRCRWSPTRSSSPFRNSIAHRQNPEGRKIAIVVLSRNRWRLVQRMVPKIVAAVNAATPASYTLIDAPVRWEAAMNTALAAIAPRQDCPFRSRSQERATARRVACASFFTSINIRNQHPGMSGVWCAAVLAIRELRPR